MKNIFISLILTAGLTANARNLLNYRTVVDLSQNKGQTYLSLMQEEIKPRLDRYATGGFKVAEGRTVVASLKRVEEKVAQKAIRAAGGIEQLKSAADKLSQKGPMSFYDLPEALGSVGIGSGRYDLATFLALVSGGGVAVKIDSENIAYNVNYGTGDGQDDERTGRSFGEAPERLALDASDKHYLTILENYVRSENEGTAQFYKSLLSILLNSDSSGYGKISVAGQAVATDFVAVYTAEQDRHLMANLRSHPWDEALLEVTLLSSFHGGQKNIMVMYKGKLTATTLQQATGCSEGERREKRASMVDYWQFSSSTDEANCSRSGINITRKDFRALGAAITSFERGAHPELVKRIESSLRAPNSRNLFASLSEFLINYRTPKRLDNETLKLADDFTAFLMQVRRDANQISAELSN